MSSYVNEAVFCPFLCLNWRPTGMCVAGVQIDNTHVLDAWHCLKLSGPVPPYFIALLPSPPIN